MKYLEHFNFQLGASLVVQWLRLLTGSECVPADLG